MTPHKITIEIVENGWVVTVTKRETLASQTMVFLSARDLHDFLAQLIPF